MGHFLLRRTASLLIVVWLVTSLTFLAMNAAPGKPSPLYQSRRTPPQEQHVLIRALGLEENLGRRYALWLVSISRGDWGTSIAHGRPVSSVVATHLPPTALLGSSALLVSLALGIPLALYCGSRPGSLADRLIGLACIVTYSTPVFWTGIVALVGLSFGLGLFPPGHLRDAASSSAGLTATTFDILHHLALPSLVLGISMTPAICQTLRSSVLEARGQPYMRTARAKGLSDTQVLLSHLLPNALGPLIQLVGLSLPMLVGGVLVIEVVFSWPGMGRLTHAAVQTRDYPLLLGATAATAFTVAVGSLLADLLEALFDPRSRTHGPERT